MLSQVVGWCPGSASSYEQAAAVRDDVAMIENPSWWPCKGVLPLKRSGRGADLGFSVVLLRPGVNGVLVKLGLKLGPYLLPVGGGVETVYKSAADVVADGWVVD